MRGRMVLRADTVEEGRFEMTASLRAHGDRGRLRGRYEQAGQTIRMELIQHDGVAWMRMPALRKLLPPGKRWIRSTDPELVGGQTLTPAAFAELLEAAGKVEDRGPGTGAGRRGHPHQGPPWTCDAWPRRRTCTRPMTSCADWEQQTAIIELEVYEYGARVDTEPPPASQVTDDSVLE